MPLVDMGKRVSSCCPTRGWGQWISQHRWKILVNVLIYLAVVSTSSAASMLGPSLLDLGLRLDASISQVTRILSAKAAGALLGILTVGRTIDGRGRWLLLTLGLAGYGLSTILAPWPVDLNISLIIFLFYGFGRAYVLCGSLMSIFALWQSREDAQAWVVGQQLSTSLGYVLGPMMVRPFLVEKPTHADDQHPADLGDDAETQVMYGWFIGGFSCLLAAATMFVASCMAGGIYMDRGKEKDHGTVSSTSKAPALRRIIITLLFINSISFGSMCRDYPSLLVTYVVKHLGWTKADGAALVSGTSMLAIFAKLTYLWLVKVVLLEVQLMLGAIATFAASILMLMFSETWSWVPWVSSGLFMIGTTSIHCTVFGWMDRHLGLQGMVGVLWHMGGCAGEIISPFFMGYLLEYVSYRCFLYQLLLCSGVCLALWVVLECLGRSAERGSRDKKVVAPL